MLETVKEKVILALTILVGLVTAITGPLANLDTSSTVTVVAGGMSVVAAGLTYLMSLGKVEREKLRHAHQMRMAGVYQDMALARQASSPQESPAPEPEPAEKPEADREPEQVAPVADGESFASLNDAADDGNDDDLEDPGDQLPDIPVTPNNQVPKDHVDTAEAAKAQQGLNRYKVTLPADVSHDEKMAAELATSDRPVSGLNAPRRAAVRRAAVNAAKLSFNHRGAIHYTQGSRRWDGIRLRKNASKREYPLYGDCSAMATWWLWNGLYLLYKCRDTVNGANWTGGFTGTMLTHGKRVKLRKNWLPGDLFIYGNGGSGKHVAMYVGGGYVMSHGSESGPFKLAWNYRGDLMQVRRAI